MRHLKYLTLLAVLSSILFFWGNWLIDLTGPDEVFYAQTAKEMAEYKTWLVPYLFGEPQFEKPILTYWFLRLGYIFFGVTNFSARFFPAFFALLGVLACYWLAFLGFKERKKAFICALVLMSGGLYLGLAKTVFTDMFFSVLILLALASFFWGYLEARRKGRGAFLFFLFSGLAVLAKGPLGALITFSAVFLFLAMRGELKFLVCPVFAGGLALFLAITLPWYSYIISRFGNAFIQEFFYNDHIRRIFEAEHQSNDTWFFYPLAALLCMFPWSFFLLAGVFYFIKRAKEKGGLPIYHFLFAWMAVVLAVFQFAHSKLVSYIFPMFPALALITGDFICSRLNYGRRLMSLLTALTWLVFLALPVGLVVMSGKYPQYAPPRGQLYTYLALHLGLLAVTFYFIIRRKFLASAYLYILVMASVFFFVFSSRASYNEFVSSRASGEYLLKHTPGGSTILCSGAFLRGIRFFTGRPVALMGGKFFSPHPVLNLDFDEVIIPFLETQPMTYGVLTKSAFGRIQEYIFDTPFKLELLKKIGNQYIIKITRS